MSGNDSAGMFDRTPVLLRSRRNLAEKSRKAVGIRTVETIDLFDDVQIRQIRTIKDEIFGTLDLCYSVDGETDRLIYKYEQIEKEKQ